MLLQHNILLLCVLVAVIALLYALGERFRAFRVLRTYKAAVPVMAYVVIVTMVMGLVRQESGGHWFHDMLSFWPFQLAYVLMIIILGIAVVDRVRKIIARKHYDWRTDTPFLLNHAGLFIAVVAATLGSSDFRQLRMLASLDQVEWRAYNEEGGEVLMPFSVELQRFIMETYDDGTPKRFASDLLFYIEDGRKIAATVDVNHPVTVEGYDIYQFGYDEMAGPNSSYSILQVVRDPWLPAVYTGIFMLIAGALWSVLFRTKRTAAKN